MQDNTPDLWRGLLPRLHDAHYHDAHHQDAHHHDAHRHDPPPVDCRHKYHFGHGVIEAAPHLTGATRLAAAAAARIGAGVVTVLAHPDTAAIYRASLPPHIILRDDLAWQDSRVTARLYGCGGVLRRPNVDGSIPVVLDADALGDLPERLTPNCILTPHEGEFERAFPQATGTRSDRALTAAKTINAHIILKGAETVIAAPDGRCVINRHASPHLATAGTGDVLAGMVMGLVAQKMPVFEACLAAVWIHGDAGLRLGVGLVASDLPPTIAEVLKRI